VETWRIRLENSNGKTIFVACPSAIRCRASSESTVIARRSGGLAPTERMRSPLRFALRPEDLGHPIALRAQDLAG